MKKLIAALLLTLLPSLSAMEQATTKCFIAKQGETILKKEGDCAERHAPCSTFKIPLSLMGFDSGILTDEKTPEWPFKDGYSDYLERWKQPHTPQLWMTNSCVWFSQVLTQELQMEKFQGYLKTLSYGNQDTSGDKGLNNGLTRCWLSSSLQISGEEQVRLLEGLVASTLPVSQKAQEMTRKILFVEDLPNGWKLYGKTGSGHPKDDQGVKNENQQTGWFVGWAEKSTPDTNEGETKRIVFAHYIEGEGKAYAGPRAKEMAKELLKPLLADK